MHRGHRITLVENIFSVRNGESLKIKKLLFVLIFFQQSESQNHLNKTFPKLKGGFYQHYQISDKTKVIDLVSTKKASECNLFASMPGYMAKECDVNLPI